MLTPLLRGFQSWPVLGTQWAADTGCYAQAERFNLDVYFDWLAARRQFSGDCIFATAPDKVGDAHTTWELSKDVLPRIRDVGFNPSFIAQDGFNTTAIDWDSFDCLFVGGSTSWKLSLHAVRVCAEAKARGKWLHIGRVNTWRRLIHYAAKVDADSVDGTLVRFGRDIYTPKILRWFGEV